MEEDLKKKELIYRTKYVLSISGIFDGLRYYKSDIESCANMIINRCNNDYSYEVLKKNIVDVLIEMYQAIFSDDLRSKVNIVPLLAKLILEENRTKYLSIVKGYKSYFNEINIYQDLRYVKFVEELKNAKSITVFSQYRKQSNDFLMNFYYLGKHRSSDYPYYKIERRYFQDGHKVLDDVVVILNLDKNLALREANQLNMKDVYYCDNNEEGLMDVNTGIMIPYKNPYIIKEDDEVRLLEGYTSIDVLDDYKKDSYYVYLKEDNNDSLLIDRINYDHKDCLFKYKVNMIKHLNMDMEGQN